MAKHKKNQGKEALKKIQLTKSKTSILDTSRILVRKISNEALDRLEKINKRRKVKADVTKDGRNIYGIISKTRLLTGLTCLMTAFKWSKCCEDPWIPPNFSQVFRVIYGYNTEEDIKDTLPKQVPLSADSRITWYNIRRVSELFLNQCIRSPVLKGQYVRRSHFKEFYQVLQQDNFQRSYLIDVGYWSNDVYHQLWILYNGKHRTFISLYDASEKITIDLPLNVDDATAQALDLEIRTKFLRGTPNLDAVDDDDEQLFGWLSAKYTPYYLKPRGMPATKFQDKYLNMLEDLDEVDNDLLHQH